MRLFIFFLLLPLGLFAQDSSSVKKRIYKPQTWDKKTWWQHRINAGYSVLAPDQTALATYKSYYYGNFQPGYGFIISNSIIRNYKSNPISLIGDLSVSRNNFVMNYYDTSDFNGQQASGSSSFKNLYLADLGLGIEIQGRYLFADIQYRIGYLTGGKTDDTLYGSPTIIKDGKLNLNSNWYQGLQLGIGVRKWGFNLRVNGNFPINRFQVNMYKDWQCSMLVRSITLGYTWGFGEKL